MGRTTAQEFSITLKDNPHEVFREMNTFITNSFGIVYNSVHLVNNLLSNNVTPFLGGLMFSLNQPYRLKESRIVMVLSGKVILRHNLIEHTLLPDQLFIVSAGSIVQLVEVFPGTQFRMIGMGTNFLQFTHKEEHLEHYLSYQQHIMMMLTPEEKKEVEEYFSLIWQTVQHPVFRREVVQSLLIALIQNLYYIRKGKDETAKYKPTRQEEIFNRFITLVNEYNKNERTVGSYADKLCLTPRYLNTLIRQVSQKTVMEWINQAVILEAKVLLRHDDLLIYQVADKLNFPNSSFFCKFFKRMTGMTPQEYQRRG